MDDWDEMDSKYGRLAKETNYRDRYNTILWVIDRLGMAEELKDSNLFWCMKYSERAVRLIREN